MSVLRKPWERRLEDLASTFGSCASTYFSPELFRRNTNNFLQTARTITFLVQKNKSDIPSFNAWYEKNVIAAWKNDKIMQWAKEARNTIEKEGDLELHSSLSVALLFSYLEEEDVTVKCGADELLYAGVRKLVRFAQKQLPTGVADAAALKIERSWVTSKLSSYELLHALGYVYSRLYDCCLSLTIHLQRPFPDTIPEPSEVTVMRDDGRQVQFVKLKDFKTYHAGTDRVRKVPDEKLPIEMRRSIEALKDKLPQACDFDSTITFYAGMAEATFKQWGNHISMVFLLNRDWMLIDMITPVLMDQAEKYFFWRTLAERIQVQNIHCLIHTAEVWLRDLKGYPYAAIKNLPITGEGLQLIAVDRDRNKSMHFWPIIKTGERAPRLGPAEVKNDWGQRMFFLVPAMRSMGIKCGFQQNVHQRPVET